MPGIKYDMDNSQLVAQAGSTPRNFSELVGVFLNIIQDLIPVVASLALLVFLWGLAKFIFRIGGDEKAIVEGKSLMKWGLIALFIMVSVWGIIKFAYDDIGFTRFGLPVLPESGGK